MDHLFEHPNTATFVAFRLIQRFVTSNPSKAYLQAVGDAFRSGSYGAVSYGGYGSLGATLAATLLHSEARQQVGETNGALREPYLKLVHLMRSMEYKDESASATIGI